MAMVDVFWVHQVRCCVDSMLVGLIHVVLVVRVSSDEGLCAVRLFCVQCSRVLTRREGQEAKLALVWWRLLGVHH